MRAVLDHHSTAGDGYLALPLRPLGGEVVGVGDELSPGLGSIKVVSINKKEIVFEMKSVDGTSQTFSRAIPTDLIP